MVSPITLDLTRCVPYLKEDEILDFFPILKMAHDMLYSKEGLGNDFLGWINLGKNYNSEEIKKIEKISEKIIKNSKVFIVIGIGGSYLGARAVIEALNNSFYNNLSEKDRKYPKIYFAGNNLSSTYLSELLDLVKDEDFSINVISKSGTTTEPAIAFRFLKKLLEDKYGKDKAKERIFITTDKEKGAMRKLCQEEGYESFVIPDDVGGRYSVLTAVGLLPIKVAGIDINQLLKGAEDGRKEYEILDLSKNNCYRYAVARHLLYMKGKVIEIIANYEPCLFYFGQWWRQLFGESQGKKHRGIFPSTVNYSTDLHSMGQYIQDGLRIFFETTINIEKPKRELVIFEDDKNIDELNFLAGKTVDFINKKAMEGTIMAHNQGEVANIEINLKEINSYSLGYMIYFFEMACAISGYLLGINPFNQEGVESYKNNMFALLGKPGYEEKKKELEKKLEEMKDENFSGCRCLSCKRNN